MLTVTDNAAQHLTHLLDESGAPEGIVVRIVFGFRGLELQPSAVCPGDATLICDGRVVLALQPHLADALADKVLDMCDDEGGGRSLDLREANPP